MSYQALDTSIKQYSILIGKSLISITLRTWQRSPKSMIVLDLITVELCSYLAKDIFKKFANAILHEITTENQNLPLTVQHVTKIPDKQIIKLKINPKFNFTT